MGKKGHLTFEKRALNIRRAVHPHPTHPLRYATGTIENNPEKSFVQNNACVIQYSYCVYLTTDYYRGEDCVKNFCRDLKKHATKIILKKLRYH